MVTLEVNQSQHLLINFNPIYRNNLIHSGTNFNPPPPPKKISTTLENSQPPKYVSRYPPPLLSLTFIYFSLFLYLFPLHLINL